MNDLITKEAVQCLKWLTVNIAILETIAMLDDEQLTAKTLTNRTNAMNSIDELTRELKTLL